MFHLIVWFLLISREDIPKLMCSGNRDDHMETPPVRDGRLKIAWIEPNYMEGPQKGFRDLGFHLFGDWDSGIQRKWGATFGIVIFEWYTGISDFLL